MALAIAGNVAIYGSLDRRTPVLQAVRDVPAGSMLTGDDLRAVEVASDASVRTVAADRWDLVVGRHAKVRIVAGSLLVAEALQDGPLVADGAGVVALQVSDGSLPSGLRERSDVHLVIPADRSDVGSVPSVVPALVVGLPVATSSATGRVSVSVEVDLAVAPMVAASDDVRVVLVAPGGPVGVTPDAGGADS